MAEMQLEDVMHRRTNFRLAYDLMFTGRTYRITSSSGIMLNMWLGFDYSILEPIALSVAFT